MKSSHHIEKKIRIASKKFKLSEFNTRLIFNNEAEQKKLIKKSDSDIEEIVTLQNKLFAEDRQSLLIILQGMDSAGKDGAIKHILKGINPQGVVVTSFKHPSNIELQHDYLWRHSIKLPEHGQIAIFNRSHYENVLISKVHPELILAERLKEYDVIQKIDKSFWKMRYNHINQFEKSNIESGTHILKFFLHLSKEEQCKRFLERIDNENKHWKFTSGDIEERKYWLEYQQAYEQAIKHTSTKIAPWYIIPADDKLQARSLIGKIILTKLIEMKPTFLPKTKEEQYFMKAARIALEKEFKPS
jgi:PPK2 family polyphosphate:nucleotide phosphotransferase